MCLFVYLSISLCIYVCVCDKLTKHMCHHLLSTPSYTQAQAVTLPPFLCSLWSTPLFTSRVSRWLSVAPNVINASCYSFVIDVSITEAPVVIYRHLEGCVLDL